MTKAKHALKIKTALVRPLFLILLLFALLLVPAMVFAEGSADAETGDSGTQDQNDCLGETFTAGTFDSPAVFDQEPVLDFESSETAFSAEIPSFDIDTPASGFPAVESDSPAYEDPSSLSDGQLSTALEGLQAPAEQIDFDSSSSPDPEPSAPVATENANGTPLYFVVEQVSMSPLLNPGSIIELVSSEYADGDLVVAQLADGTHIVKMLDGDLLVPLGAGVSYSLDGATILGKAALSVLTSAELEAGGLGWSRVLATTAVAPSVGDGSDGNPYQIATWQNLYWITAPDGVGIPDQPVRWAAHYIQSANIDFTDDGNDIKTWDGNQGWTPIGNETTKFTGSYDGGGFTISGLFVNRPTAPGTGLFGFTGPGAKISNISLEDVNFTSTDVEGTVGGLVGWNEGTITNSYVTGSINGVNSVGGLVGLNTGTIEYCYATSTVNGEHSVGGLVGENYLGTINNCYSTGNVKCTELAYGMHIGGLVGLNSGTIANSYATGEVKGGMTVGGLVGSNMEGNISSSYATGSVNGSVNNNGGLVGYNNGTITNSYWNIDSHLSPGIGKNSGAGDAIGRHLAEILTLAFHRDTLGWGATIATTTATVNRGGYNPYPFPRLFWELGIGNSPIWYIYESSEEGGNRGGFSFDGFTFTLPLLPGISGVLTNIPSQSANAIITPAFVTGGSAVDLNRAIAAYNQAMQSYESNKGSMSATEKAVAEVELAVAKAAIIALQLRLAAENGQPVDLAALMAAYQAAQAALNSNRRLLAADQIAAAQALLDAIASVISSFST